MELPSDIPLPVTFAVLVAALILSTLVSALLLKASCGIFNRIIGETVVPTPSVGKAMGIVVVGIAGEVAAIIGLRWVLAQSLVEWAPSSRLLAATLLSTPISLIWLVVTLLLFLPASLGRSVWISVIYTGLTMFAMIVTGSVVLAGLLALGVNPPPDF